MPEQEFFGVGRRLLLALVLAAMLPGALLLGLVGVYASRVSQ